MMNFLMEKMLWKCEIQICPFFFFFKKEAQQFFLLVSEKNLGRNQIAHSAIQSSNKSSNGSSKASKHSTSALKSVSAHQESLERQRGCEPIFFWLKALKTYLLAICATKLLLSMLKNFLFVWNIFHERSAQCEI